MCLIELPALAPPDTRVGYVGQMVVGMSMQKPDKERKQCTPVDEHHEVRRVMRLRHSHALHLSGVPPAAIV